MDDLSAMMMAEEESASAPLGKPADVPFGSVKLRNEKALKSKTSQELCEERTDAVLEALCLVLDHHGIPPEVRLEFETQFKKHLNKILDENMWVKCVKQFLTSPMARYLKNEPPKSSGNDLVLTGRVKKWMKPRLCCFNARNTHLWYSWFQAKRGALPLSPEYVEQTYEDHQVALTQPDDGCPKTIQRIFQNKTFRYVLDKVKRGVGGKKVDGKFQGTVPFGDFLTMQPSTNACYEASRRLGGQQGYLVDSSRVYPTMTYEAVDPDPFANKPRSQTILIHYVIQTPELVRMDWFPNVWCKSRGYRTNTSVSIYCSPGREDWRRYNRLRSREITDACMDVWPEIRKKWTPTALRLREKILLKELRESDLRRFSHLPKVQRGFVANRYELLSGLPPSETYQRRDRIYFDLQHPVINPYWSESNYLESEEFPLRDSLIPSWDQVYDHDDGETIWSRSDPSGRTGTHLVKLEILECQALLDTLDPFHDGGRYMSHLTPYPGKETSPREVVTQFLERVRNPSNPARSAAGDFLVQNRPDEGYVLLDTSESPTEDYDDNLAKWIMFLSIIPGGSQDLVHSDGRIKKDEVHRGTMTRVRNIKRSINRVREKRVREYIVEEERYFEAGNRKIREENYISDLHQEYPALCNATIQAVLEPLKIRVISKGDANMYYMMKPLQKSLWRTLKDIPGFQLIGRPFEVADLGPLMDRALSGFSVAPGDTPEWFSVDYSAATDGLSWHYSGAIFREVISLLPEEIQCVAHQVLGPHNLWYPDPTYPEGRRPGGKMSRGQLMGSILSFPILCLANLGVYLLNTESIYKDLPDIPYIHDEILKSVLVNGDDMLYIADKRLWSSHIDIGKKVGLEMSVGKSYHHSSYLNINSTSVHFDLSDNQRVFIPESPPSISPHSENVSSYIHPPRQVEFLNTGLFLGRHKVQTVQDQSDDDYLDTRGKWKKDQHALELASAHRSGIRAEEEDPVCIIPQILAGCLPGRQSDILAMYLSRHGADIKKRCTIYSDIGNFDEYYHGRTISRNLFLPRSIGGCGINAPPGFHYKVTDQQKILAHKIYQDYMNAGCFLDSQFPLRGYEFSPEVLQKENNPWDLKSSETSLDRINLKTISRPSRRLWGEIRLGLIPSSSFSNCPIVA